MGPPTMEAIRPKRVNYYSPYSELFGARKRSRESQCTVIVGHPTDEIVGGGCLISKLSKVRIVHVSDGAPLSLGEAQAKGCESISSYVEARKHECLAALSLAHVSEERVVELGFAQLEAPYRMVKLTRQLLSLLQRNAPQILLTHAYEGGHPDHDSVAFAAHAAVRLLQKNGLKPPVIFEMAIYPGKKGTIEVPEFLHSPSLESTTLMLDSKAKALKEKMVSCFKTQRMGQQESPLGPEKFRRAPVYNFRLAPHMGELHYEKLNWGMTGTQWRALAGQALDELFVPGPHAVQ